MDAHAERFLAAVESNKAEWTALDVRAVAVRGKDELWHLRGLHVTLRPEPTKVTPGPCTADLWCTHQNLAVDELPNLVKAIEAGHLKIAGWDLVLQQEGQSRVSLHYMASVKDSRYASYGELPSSSHILGTRTNHQFNANAERLDQIEMDLAQLDPPWESYQDVIANFLGGAQHDTRVHDLSIHFVAPLGAVLEDVKYEGGSLLGEVRGTSRTKGKGLILAVIEHLANDSIRRSQAKLVKRRGVVAWHFKHRLQPEVVRTVAILTYAGLRAGYWTRLAPKGNNSILSRAIEHFLPGKDILQDGLLNPAVRSRNLEPWAALLFARLGYQTTVLGAFPGELPDLLAIGPNEDVLVIECTEDGPDVNDKLGKLSQRLRRLRLALDKEVQGVLLTRAPLATVPESHKLKAAQEQIALLAREQLVELGQHAQQPGSPEKAATFIESCIPAGPVPVRRGRGLTFL